MILHRPGAAVDLSCFVDGGRVRVVVNAGIPARAATDGPARGRGVAATRPLDPERTDGPSRGCPRSALSILSSGVGHGAPVDTTRGDYFGSASSLLAAQVLKCIRVRVRDLVAVRPRRRSERPADLGAARPAATRRLIEVVDVTCMRRRTGDGHLLSRRVGSFLKQSKSRRGRLRDAARSTSTRKRLYGDDDGRRRTHGPRPL